MESKDIDRRSFITSTGKTTAVIALSTTSLLSFSATAKQAASKAEDDHKYDFIMPRAKFKCNSHFNDDMWETVPKRDRCLLTEFSTVVRCRVNNDEPTAPRAPREDFTHIVEFDDIMEMRKYSFILMTASGGFEFNTRQKKNFKDYLIGGGFILMDDCVAYPNGDHFFQSSIKLLRNSFDSSAVRPIPLDHEVFHNLYDFENRGVAYWQGHRHPAMGLFIDGRLAAFVSSTDLHCGWQTTQKNNHLSKECIKMGINILMYAITH